MNISYLSFVDLGLPIAGTINALEISDNLRKLGNRVTLIVPRLGTPSQKKEIEIKYVFCPKIAAIRYVSFHISIFLYVLRHIIMDRPDLVMIRESYYFLSLIVLLKVFNIPYVLMVPGIGVTANPEYKSGLSKRFCSLSAFAVKTLRRKAAKVVTVTEDIGHLLAEDPRISSRRIEVVPNGVNTEDFRPAGRAKVLSKLDLDNSRFYVGYIGTIKKHEGVGRILKAAPHILSKFPNTEFLIVGGPEDEEKRDLELMSHRMGLQSKVKFVGLVPVEDSVLWINAFDVCMSLIEPHKSGWSPLKLYAYMACGRPVVASDIESFGFIEEANTGLLAEYEDDKQVAECTIRLLQSERLRREMGKNARRYVLEHHCWSRLAQDIHGICQDVYQHPGKEAYPHECYS